MSPETPLLFDAPKARARARRTDPSTSHIAARTVERTGHAAAQREACLGAVRTHPGQTAAEIAAATGLERHVPSRRLPELRQDGLIYNGLMKRVCSVMGTLAMTWWPFAEEAAPQKTATSYGENRAF